MWSYPVSHVLCYPGGHVRCYPGGHVQCYSGSHVRCYPGGHVRCYPMSLCDLMFIYAQIKIRSIMYMYGFVMFAMSYHLSMASP